MRSVPAAAVAPRASGPAVATAARGPARAGPPARAARARRRRGLWVEPVGFLELIEGPALAAWACATATRLRPALPPRPPGGAPRLYADETVLLTLLVLRTWRRSLETMADWLARDAALAAALGFAPGGPTISAAQLSRRSRRLGLAVYLLFGLGLVALLVRRGAVTGAQLILDASLLPAWSRGDPDGRRAGRRGGRPTCGYKLHTVVDRWSHLPLLVIVTPAPVHEVSWAPLLLTAAVALFGLRAWAAYADAAYDSRALSALIRHLGAVPVIDYCLRSRGKRFLATRFFADQWRRLRAPRTAVERCFAWLKRYYGLADFQVQGLAAVWQHALLVHAAMLAVALVAHRSGRPDLMTARTQVLAYVTS
jgi:Transposase DDE domain